MKLTTCTLAKLTHLSLGLVLATSLVGCGQHTLTAAKLVNSKTSTVRETAPPLPVGASPTGPAALKQLMTSVVAAQQTTTGFTATVNTMDKGPSGQESDTIDVAYEKPSTLHLDMIKATGQAQGAKILWTGGNSVQIKISLGFLPITTSIDLTDSRIKSKNGWTLKQTEVNAVYKVLLDPAAQLQIVGQQQSTDGHALTMVQVKSAFSPSPADHEVIGIDPATGLVGIRALFTGTTEIYRLAITDIHVGTPSSTEMSL